MGRAGCVNGPIAWRSKREIVGELDARKVQEREGGVRRTGILRYTVARVKSNGRIAWRRRGGYHKKDEAKGKLQNIKEQSESKVKKRKVY